MARNVFLTACTCFAVFTLLELLKHEPGHPQELCALLLGGMLLGSSFLTRRRHTGIILGVIGFLAGLLSMTKPNLGVFAALAGFGEPFQFDCGAAEQEHSVWRKRARGAGPASRFDASQSGTRRRLLPPGVGGDTTSAYPDGEFEARAIAVLELVGGAGRGLRRRGVGLRRLRSGQGHIGRRSHARAWCSNTLATTEPTSIGRTLELTNVPLSLGLAFRDLGYDWAGEGPWAGRTVAPHGSENQCGAFDDLGRPVGGPGIWPNLCLVLAAGRRNGTAFAAATAIGRALAPR